MKPVIKLKALGLAGLLAAVAMVIVASVGVVSASAALPKFSKFGVCTNAGAVTGFPKGVWYYTGSGCTSHTAPAAGVFALGTGENGLSPFISKSATAKEKAVLETKAGHKVECESTTTTVEDLGEITGERNIRTVVTFHKCSSTGSTCTSAGAKESGEIVTEQLVGKLVYINEATKTVGVALEPASTTGERLFAQFECPSFLGTETIKVGHAGGAGGDSIVCPITPVNGAAGTSFTLTCAPTATKGEQNPTEYVEGGTKHVDYLESEGKGPITFGWEQSSEKTTDNITTSEAGSIEA